MATSNQDTNIKDVAAPASATTTNIGHVLGLNAAKTQDVLIPLSMLRTVIAAELKTALAAITSGSPDVPVLDGNNLKYMTLANFAKVVGGQGFPFFDKTSGSSGTRYFKLCSSSASRRWPLHIGGSGTSAKCFDVVAAISPTGVTAIATPVHDTAAENNIKLYQVVSGSSCELYVELASYCSLTIFAYTTSIIIDCVQVESIPSGAVAVTIS